MQFMTKNITIFIYSFFFHREIVKLDHFITLFLIYANTVLWRSRRKIHRFVAAPLNISTYRVPSSIITRAQFPAIIAVFLPTLSH